MNLSELILTSSVEYIFEMSKLEDNIKMWLSPSSVQPTAVCAASAVHNMGWRRSRQCQCSVVKTHSRFGENGMMREKISP